MLVLEATSFLRHPGARFCGAPPLVLRNFVASVVKKFSHDLIGSGRGVVGGGVSMERRGVINQLEQCT